jgi:hypothetical protein
MMLSAANKKYKNKLESPTFSELFHEFGPREKLDAIYLKMMKLDMLPDFIKL